MNQQELFDVTVIGGGPSGLYSAFYSGLREMKTKIIEYQPELGGKLHVYPEKMIWDVGGITPAPAAKLMKQMVEQGLTFDPEVVLGEKINSIEKNADGMFVLTSAAGHVHYSKTVIIAVGSGILNPKKLNVKDAEQFETANIHYAVQSLKDFKDKTVVISGGGNAAIDWANELRSVAKQVYITFRKDCPSGHEAPVRKLMNSCATCFPKTCISGLVPCENRKKVQQVALTDQQTGKVTFVDVDAVIVNHGYEIDTSLLKNSPLAIEMADDFYVAGNSMSETSVAGLYAVGDILSYEGKLQLIAGAFQDAANAVNRAKQFNQPKAEKTAMVSSHHDAFKKRNSELVKEMMKETGSVQ